MRRIASLALTLALTLSLTVPAQAAEKREPYTDTAAHYAKEAVETWSGYGVLKGYPDGTFRPDGTITRAELAAVLDRVMGYRDKGENIYSDLSDGTWYGESLLRLAAQGVFAGDGKGHMRPEALITRQEAYTALSRVMGLEEREQAPGFVDDADIAPWARGYVASMGAAGYIRGDKEGRLRPGGAITRGEVVTVLSRMVPGFVNADGTYSADCAGNLVVNAGNVKLRDMTVEGDLIVADGVAEGDVSMEKVTVKGDIILRGCGENSFHILPGCEVKSIIVTKTTGGRTRLVNESGRTIPMIWVNDGKSGIILDGGAFREVVVACDAPVELRAGTVETLSVTGNATLTVSKNAAVSSLELTGTAKGAQVTVEGEVTRLTNDAGARVDKQNGGVVGAGTGGNAPDVSGGGASGGGGSSGGGGGGGSTTRVISKVKLQLLPPQFGEVPDTADVLGTGYTAETVWENADGTPASYRWKTDGDTPDTFTADQAYRALITLTPTGGYSFAESLKVEVTDGRDIPTGYTPAQVTVSGRGRVVTMIYERTEHREPVSGVTTVAPAAVSPGETAKLEVSYWNNLLADPATFSYQWYRCDNAAGEGKTPVPGATGKEYTIPAGDTQTGGTLYYCCEVTAMEKIYPSAVKAVEIRDTLDADTIPTPAVGSELTVDESGRWMTVELGELTCHKDVSYSVEVNGKVRKKGGAELGGAVMTERFDDGVIPENGVVSWRLDLTDLLNDYVFAMLKAGLCYDIELGEVTVTVRPAVRNVTVADKVEERKLDMAGKWSFHILSAGSASADEPWQGPSKSLRLVIDGSVGTFHDKAAPDRDPVPAGDYEQVKAVFRKGADWIEALEGTQETSWDGRLRIPEAWLDGFETGASMAQVICVFYAAGESGEGMNVYTMELTSLNITFQPENS